MIFLDRLSPEIKSAEVESLNTEVKFLYQIKHPNIIKLYSHFETGEHIVLVFEKFGRAIVEFLIDIRKKKKGKIPYEFTIKDLIKIFRGIGSALV